MDRKKIAILSVYDVYNYGSILQTYATQQVIKELGFDSIIIRNDHRDKLSQLKRCFNLPLLQMKMNFIIRDIYVKYLNKTLGEYFYSRREAFDRFIKTCLFISPDWGDKISIAAHIKDFNYALVGSDQVWNPMNLGKDFYTMSFIPMGIKRVAYAPSFGVASISERQKEKIKDYLLKIDCISIRELSGQKIIKELIGKEVPVVADPTILMPFEKWEEFVSVHPYKKKPYILCYFLGTIKSHREFANRLKRKTGIDIISLPHSDEICKWDFNFGDYTPLNVGPQEFVNLIAHASYVCTDSFHATVFSNLFSRQFFSFSRYANDDNIASTNSRIPSLLSILGNEGRYVDSSIDIADNLLDEINFKCVKKKISELRHTSREYLLKSLDCDGIV